MVIFRDKMRYFAERPGQKCPNCKSSATQDDIELSGGIGVKCDKCTIELCLNCMVPCGVEDHPSECETTWCSKCAPRCPICKGGARCDYHEENICWVCEEECPKCGEGNVQKLRFSHKPGYYCSNCDVLI